MAGRADLVVGGPVGLACVGFGRARVTGQRIRGDNEQVF